MDGVGSTRGLLLDVGGVLIRTPFELLDAAEHRLGLPEGALGSHGPFSSAEDPRFTDVLTGELEERRYWAERAADVSRMLSIPADTEAFFRILFDADEDEIVRSEVRGLVDAAERSGIRVGILTNDLHDFHGEEWVRRMTVFSRLEVLIDGSRTGHLKPAPEAYERAVAAMGIPAGQLVLLDDQPTNVRGARAAGLRAVLFDPVDPARAVREIREVLGLGA